MADTGNDRYIWESVGRQPSKYGDKIYSAKLESDLDTILGRGVMSPTNWGRFCWIMKNCGFSVDEAAGIFHRRNCLGRNYRGYDETRLQLARYYAASGGDCGTQEHKKAEYTREELIVRFHTNFKPLRIDFVIPDFDILYAAIAYYKAGFHVVPAGEDKKPLIKWRKPIDYAAHPLNPSDLNPGYWSRCVAVLGTATHTFLDVDAKSEKHPDGLNPAEISRIKELFRDYHIEQSKNGGLHVWALGDIRSIDNRAYIDAAEGGLTIKGIGSYIIAYPSPGYILIK